MQTPVCHSCKSCASRSPASFSASPAKGMAFCLPVPFKTSGSHCLHHAADGMHAISILASLGMLHRQVQHGCTVGVNAPHGWEICSHSTEVAELQQKQIVSTSLTLESQKSPASHNSAGHCDQGRHQPACVTKCNRGRQLPPLGSHRDHQAPG